MKHAVFCGTRNIYGDMETAAKALYLNSSVDVIHFLIEDAEFPRPLPSFVVCHDVSGQQWFTSDGPNTQTRWSWMVLMRAALCHVLTGVDRVLSLDCDMAFHGDVDELFDLPVDGCYFAAVTERRKSQNGLQYTNFGVVLHNLEMLRDGKADECIAVLNSRRYTWPEQDVMNYLCQGRIADMPKKYNDMWFNDPIPNPVVTHYAARGRETWADLPDVVRYRSMSWSDVAAERRSRAPAGAGTVLFATNHSLERAENIRPIYEAYDGAKELVSPVEAIAKFTGYPVVVTDTLTPHVPDKDFALVNIGHGIAGGKLYGTDEQRNGIDPRALAQTDFVVNASTRTCGLVAKQYGIAPDKVVPLGFPRTDAMVGRRKGDGGTILADHPRAYLYAPTFRGPNDGDHLPVIDWALVDSTLEDDELLVIKRHYFTLRPVTSAGYEHIVELSPNEGSTPYLIDCDVLITDYSSIIFDGYVLGKPCVLLTDDMDAYMSSRGMYLDYPRQYSSRWLDAEGNEEGLLAMVRDAAARGMGDTENECLSLVADMCDGHSTERVIDLIRGLL